MAGAAPTENSPIDEARVDTLQFLLGLRAQGAVDVAVLRAMERIPRTLFAPQRYADLARTDVSIPLACGQTMTPPGIVAGMLGALMITPGARILEIGAGSGYVTALMAAMGAHVVAIERFGTLALAAHERLQGIGSALLTGGFELQHGDGLLPTRLLGRFERIVLNGAVTAIPDKLFERLAPGGRLVGAIRHDGVTRRLVAVATPNGIAQQLGPPIRLAALTPGVAATL